MFYRNAKRGRGDAGSGKANASQGAQAYSTVLSGTLAAFTDPPGADSVARKARLSAADAGRSASAAVNR